MLVIPAIDVIDGRCVRLRQGDYEQKTVYSSDPVEVARQWVDQGAEFLHVVDLDGARAGRPMNLDVIGRIAAAVEVGVELGGGLRSNADVAAALDCGLQRVIIGTAALEQSEWFTALCAVHPGRIALGLDARDGRVATRGWLEDTETTAVELATDMDALGLAALVYTDIARDGMMRGPNVEATAELATHVRTPVIASGGVTTADDVRRLSALPIVGCIIGRALYEGPLTLAEALAAAT